MISKLLAEKAEYVFPHGYFAILGKDGGIRLGTRSVLVSIAAAHLIQQGVGQKVALVTDSLHEAKDGGRISVADLMAGVILAKNVPLEKLVLRPSAKHTMAEAKAFLKIAHGASFIAIGAEVHLSVIGCLYKRLGIHDVNLLSYEEIIAEHGLSEEVQLMTRMQASNCEINLKNYQRFVSTVVKFDRNYWLLGFIANRTRGKIGRAPHHTIFNSLIPAVDADLS